MNNVNREFFLAETRGRRKDTRLSFLHSTWCLWQMNYAGQTECLNINLYAKSLCLWALVAMNRLGQIVYKNDIEGFVS